MSGTIVTSAPRPTSSSASGLDSGRVTMMRMPASGCSATDLPQDTVGSRIARLIGEPPSELRGLADTGDANDVAAVRRSD